MSAAVTVRGLRKAYPSRRGTTTVLDGVDLDVEAGSVLALLGANGAGKTTTVHILATLLTPDAGTVTVAGCDLATDPRGVRAAIGLTGQLAAVDALMTGEENLRLMADLRRLGRRAGRVRVAELLERFDLGDAARRPTVTYSGGMRRRLDLAMTLVGDPQVVFLDEPTTGLDPRSRRTTWDVVEELTASGVSVLLTTQYLEEADRLADRVALLDSGRVVAEGTPAELKSRVGEEVLVVTGPDGDVVLRLPVDGTPAGLRRALDALEAGYPGGRDGGDAVTVALRSPSLDDVFLTLTGTAKEAS